MYAQAALRRRDAGIVQCGISFGLTISIAVTVVIAGIDALPSSHRSLRVIELAALLHGPGDEEVSQDSDCDWRVQIPPNCDFYPRPDPWHSTIEPLAAVKLDYELFWRW